ncbi:MAG: hypothetical protein HY550_11040 [Elusimicrobia bacterium]|nr:hypothetical protein [Elusimicrobiota bacterium]
MLSKRGPAFLPVLLACANAAAAGDTAAVLSSAGGAYLEAFSSFQAAYGKSVPYFDLSKGKPVLPPDTVTIVTFGGKAAGYPWPSGSNIVYVMAPGVLLKARPPGKAVKIRLLPDFGVILSRLKRIQPGLKRLQIFWMSPYYARYEETFRTEGEKLGIQITAPQLMSSDEIPGQLRQALGEADALWIPPDPLLVTAENLLILKEFSWANGLPFYGSTKGMTREGAVASVGVSFRDMGAAAALAAGRLNSGEDVQELVFPGTPEITLNAAAAKKCGLEFHRAVLEEADYLFP